MTRAKVKHFREYHELNEIEKAHIRQRFKLDYNGCGFIDRYRLTRECFRKLKEESRLVAY